MQSTVRSLEAAQEDARDAMKLGLEAYGEGGCDELPVLDDVLDNIEERIHDLIVCMRLPDG